MNKHYQQLIKKQPQIKVIARTEDKNNQLQFAVLATFFAGIFYFFGTTIWSALVGG